MAKLYALSNVQADHTLAATYRTIPVVRYTITATAGPGGNIEPGGIFVVDAGTDLVFTLSPDPGYELESLTLDGNDVTADAVDA